jgi:hypothetical protein
MDPDSKWILFLKRLVELMSCNPEGQDEIERKDVERIRLKVVELTKN